MPTFEEILEKATVRIPSVNGERLKLAYDYAERLYAGRLRVNGESFLDHALEVADILMSFNPDENSIVAAILHGVPGEPKYSEKEIVALFGDDVASLVSALGILGRIKTVNKSTDLDNFRKMFLAIAKDIRVIIIKLADRLQNMRNLGMFPVAKQKNMARETLDIFVPVASRLGIYNIKVQLEDLCFKYLFPKQFEILNSQLEEYKAKRGKDISEIKKELKAYLEEHNVHAEVEGRIKNLYSIYRKLKLRSHTTLDDIFDVFATRVVLSTRNGVNGKEQTDHLYAVLGLIHNKWKPVANRFKDYIAVAKPNGYQSLHTAVLGLSPLSNQATEIQIRSQRMNEEAEYGIASHWMYEDLKKMLKSTRKDNFSETVKDNTVGKYLVWLDALSRLQKDVNSGSEFMEALKVDVFSDRIFVLTPSGDVRDLPQEATPIDFAYSIHSDIGNRAILAKVNGAVVPLDHKLKNGEVVEIVCGSKPNPKLNWLSFSKSASAKSKIRSYFRGMDKERNFREGKEMINKVLLRMHKPFLDDELSLFREYGDDKLPYRERVSLIEEIGNGSVLVAPVLRRIFGKGWRYKEEKESAKDADTEIILPKKRKGKTSEDGNIRVAGETGVPYKFAMCCRPVSGDPIVAYVTRGNSVTLHHKKCKLLLQAEARRIMDASWGTEIVAERFPVKVSLRARNRAGLIRDITEVITGNKVSILHFGKEKKEEKDVSREVVLGVEDEAQFKSVIESLQMVRDVLKVEKVD